MKRGSSGLSLVVPVRKPAGMTSHDVVNRVRRVFGEKRVGHAGTLDPLAEGVLPILVGPATRLNAYLVAHDKTYTVDIVFGTSTTTDDSEGETLHEAPVPANVCDVGFATQFCAGLKGVSKQLPPVYSAIKVNGRKACDEARKGNIVELEPRDIEIFDARVLAVGDSFADEGKPYWTVQLSVSKGTYIRALARDIGTKFGSYAHVGALRRDRVGDISLDDCVSLEQLEALRDKAAIDPLRLLNMRLVFPSPEHEVRIGNGGALAAASVELFQMRKGGDVACCIPAIAPSKKPLDAGERIAVVVKNRLKAIYAFDADSGLLQPDCVFQTGVSRGCDI